MMKIKLTLFVAVLAVALFGMGCASTETGGDPLKNGLVAYYPFNGNAKDESGNGNHGKVNGASLGLDRHGTPEAAHDFDGIDDYIDLPALNYNKNNSFAVSFWFKPKSEQQVQYVVDMRQNKKKGAAATIIYNPYGKKSLAYTVYGSGAQWVPFEVTLETGRSYHIVVLHNSISEKAVCYIDSNKSASISMLSLTTKGTPHQRIGYRAYNDRATSVKYTAGSIDDVRIYNRALSDEEVKALYDLEKPKGK